MTLPRIMSLLCLSITGLLVGSCTAYVSSTPLDRQGSQPVHGVVYYLPKTVLEMTITYTVAQKHAWEGELVETKQADPKAPPAGEPKITPIGKDPTGKDIEGIPYGRKLVFMVDPIAIAPKAVADAKQAYLIDTDALDAINVAVSDGQIGVRQDGLLMSIGAQFEDKTGAIITSIFTSGLNIASAFLMPGPTFLKETGEELPKELKNPVGRWVFKKVVVKRYIDPDSLDPLSTGDIDSKINALEQSLPETNKASVGTDALAAINGVKGSNPYHYSDEDLVAGLFPDAKPRPVVHVILFFPNEHTPKESQSPLRAQRKSLVYRVPGPVQIAVFVTQVLNNNVSAHLALMDTISMAQSGFVASVELGSEVFATRKFKMSFDNLTGTLGSYEFSGSSSGEGMAKTLLALSESLKTQLPGLRNSGSARELADLKTEAALLTQEKSILQLQKEIADLKKQIAAGGTNSSGP